MKTVVLPQHDKVARPMCYIIKRRNTFIMNDVVTPLWTKTWFTVDFVIFHILSIDILSNKYDKIRADDNLILFFHFIGHQIKPTFTHQVVKKRHKLITRYIKKTMVKWHKHWVIYIFSAVTSSTQYQYS